MYKVTLFEGYYINIDINYLFKLTSTSVSCNIFRCSTKGVKGDLDLGKKSSNSAQKLCSYILQDDNLYPFFTVNETMLIATNLKISSRCMSHNDKQILIDNILDTLHLVHAKETRCRNLSGGQKVNVILWTTLMNNL